MDIITKETMIQYETVRQSGVTNMFDYYQVMAVARRLSLTALSLVTRDEYVYILQNFGDLMQKFGVSQDPIPGIADIREEGGG